MSNKTSAERSIEALTWASVVIWLGFALVMDLLSYVGLVVMVLGIILLSSAIYQRSRGWHTSLTIWIFGIWMAVFSVLEIVGNIVSAISPGSELRIDLWVYLGIALISMGVAVVLRSVQTPGGMQLSRARRPSEDDQETAAYDGDPRPHIPRRVEADLSSAYFPAPGESGRTAPQSGYRGQRPDVDSRAQTVPLDDYGYDPQATQAAARTPYEPPLQATERGPAAQPAFQRGEARRYETPPLDSQSVPTGYETKRLDDEEYYYDQARPAAEPTQLETDPYEEPPRPASRRTARRRASPEAAPDDLQARVDDIIRRSRERRAQSPDEPLPY